MDEKEPKAFVREVDGQLVLEDPVALAMVRAVEKHNCLVAAKAQADRVRHFSSRVQERSLRPEDVVITLINADDAHGKFLADALMPGHDWQAYRDRGEIPFARGLAARGGVEDFIEQFDAEAWKKLKDMKSDLVVVIVDRGVAEVVRARDVA
jgi:hypothetical protein